ncbi:hypothetical protein EJ994_11090 [Maribacter sp. MJ134]|uniref:type IV toxin-antitoxin system AbiEi family antitoxin n=1 Tax=Maribacter sp. MJ134 TaxID=2496865 RepID=UPI000F8184A3|nr:type IV toxin-antitoxin system AbiEi family antitoxin [Maribacter sp. MJ134]AZQ59325.1 hypothetical protein EJ994_11090 [Maribacter sp. MJ134]
MLSTIYLNEFFDELDFATEVRYVNLDVKSEEKIYTINGESVFVEFKNEVRPHNISLFEKTRSKELPVLVASKYITPKAKEALKARNINYIDSFGNAFLNLDNLKLYIEKNNGKPVHNQYSDVFTQSGGQILFHLLQNPELINATYRHLAEISKVSLGSVSKMINGLLDEDFAVKWDNEKKYQLVRMEELLEKWIDVLNQKILPVYKLGKYSFSKNRFEIKENSPEFETRWGGESGAAMLTNYLKPEKYTLFTNRPKQDLIKNYRLLPQEDGEISVYHPFWKLGSCDHDYEDSNVVAHPLLIYAELIYSGNDRNIETAKIIFDEYIKPNL